ncbi:hypothetical protein EVAR_101659_1, partial [Eumeta japonica]
MLRHPLTNGASRSPSGNQESAKSRGRQVRDGRCLKQTAGPFWLRVANDKDPLEEVG